ncbi:MAG: hypothetical protein J1E78_06985, partial [Muribaculaceae bacterium]|nr:hypothetical protein [Muribaculaceae bacterium]
CQCFFRCQYLCGVNLFEGNRLTHNVSLCGLCAVKGFNGKDLQSQPIASQDCVCNTRLQKTKQ